MLLGSCQSTIYLQPVFTVWKSTMEAHFKSVKMFGGNNKDKNHVNDTQYSRASIVDFQQINASWLDFRFN